MAAPYDVIVVGARCAGSPTAMLLAQKGYRVLVVDRATFPSDTVSTHFIHPPGVASLERWGLLDAVRAAAARPSPPTRSTSGPFKLVGIAAAHRRRGAGVRARAAPCSTRSSSMPRRTPAPKCASSSSSRSSSPMTTAASPASSGRDAGGAHRHRGGDGRRRCRRPVLDGRQGRRARAVQREASARGNYYTYWSNLPVDGFEVFVRPHHGWAAIPTNDDLTLVVSGVAHALFDDYHHNVESTYLSLFDSAPDFAERIRGAKREERFAGTGDLPNFFRKPSGPGWALVGDAGYHKDPLTAFGITDAFRDVELLVDALDQSFKGERPFDDAMENYQQRRDEATMPMFELTCQLAAMEPPSPETQQLLGAVLRQPGGDGRLRQRDGRDALTARVLQPRQHRPDLAPRASRRVASPHRYYETSANRPGSVVVFVGCAPRERELLA